MYPGTSLVCLVLLLLQDVNAKRIWSYAALGDSYAAGDGAGSSTIYPHLDKFCGRFNGAYPVLLADDARLDVQPFDFQNVACGGATTETLLFRQAHYAADKDLVTIQIGGNEVDFLPVVNECIMQWRPFSTCDRELDKSRTLIQSSDLLYAFHKLFEHINTRVRPDALILVLGYAKFFNTDTTQCNNASFSLTHPTNVLSNELRETFNELVDMLNTVIKSTAKAHGMIYVDIDKLFEGHRFCEKGVQEPHLDQDRTWFFRQASKHYTYAEPPVENLINSRQVTIQNYGLRGSSDLTRTFHPTHLAHRAIAEEILSIIETV